MFGVPHRVAHDLESLFYVLLFVCTHLGGPCNTVGNPPLYGASRAGNNNHPSGMKEWFTSIDLRTLGDKKFSHIIGFFDTKILPFISPYFKPLTPVLISLRKAIFPQQSETPFNGRDTVHGNVTCSEVIKALKATLLSTSLINKAEQANTTLGKRSLPGDLNVAPDGWNVIRPTKKILSKEPSVKPAATRRVAKLMTKGHGSASTSKKG
jgi:hypothetical protein